MPGASGDFNPIHWSDRVATSVGLPGVIAHGMYTLALAGRAVADWAGGAAARVTFGARFTKPVVVPDDDDGAVVRSPGAVKSVEDGLATIELTVTNADQKVLGMAGPGAVVRCRAPRPTSRSPTGRRCGSAVRRRALVEATTRDELVRRGRRRRRRRASRCWCSAAEATSSSPTTGFDGTVVRVATSGRRVDGGDACGGAEVVVEAGEDWDALVARAVERGVERRRGAVRHPRHGRGDADPERRRLRPGGRRDDRRRCTPTTGSTAHARTMPPPTAGSATARAVFKRDPGRYVVRRGDVPVHARRPRRAGAVRRAGPRARRRDRRSGRRRPRCARPCSALRRGKGMVLDAEDHDTWSAGSFFTNPFVDAVARCRTGAPAYPQPDGSVKTSAAWLIERAGFAKGYGDGRVAALDQAHAGADQPRRRDDRRPAGARRRDPRRRPGDLRHRPPPRARPGQLRPLARCP